MGWDSRTSNRRKPPGWDRTRRRIYHRDEQACVKCGRGLCLADARCDHIVPWWKGGDDSDANLQTLCVPCHNSKCSAEQTERVNHGAPRR